MYREGTYLNIIKILYDKLTANAIFIGEKAESIPSKIRNKARMSIVATFIQHSFGNTAAAAAKSLQSCPTLCDPIDGSPLGSSVPGIFQARTLEWVAISFSNAWKWKVKMKLLSRVRLLETPWTAVYQAPPSMGVSRQEYWSGVPLPSPIRGTKSSQSHRDRK